MTSEMRGGGCVARAGMGRVKLQQVTSIKIPPGLLTQHLV